MRTRATFALFAAGLVLTACSTADDPTPAPASNVPSVPGMIIYSSSFDVDRSEERRVGKECLL